MLPRAGTPSHRFVSVLSGSGEKLLLSWLAGALTPSLIAPDFFQIHTRGTPQALDEEFNAVKEYFRRTTRDVFRVEWVT